MQIMLMVVLLAVVAVLPVDAATAQDHSYDVSGYGDDGYVTGTVDSWNGQREVEGTITTEDGEEKSFEGEWNGDGQIEA